jgi:hypothetical protein
MSLNNLELKAWKSKPSKIASDTLKDALGLFKMILWEQYFG